MGRNIEELQKQLAGTSDTIEKIDLMIELAYVTRRSDAREALKLASTALRLARAKKDMLRMARSTTMVGLCEQLLTRHSIALKRFQQALIPAETLGDTTLLSTVHYGFGITYASLGNYEQAMESLRLGLVFAQEAASIELEGCIHNGIAVVHTRLSDYSRALEHYSQSLQRFEAVQDVAEQALIINNLGGVYLALFDLEQAFESFTRSNTLAMASGNIRAQAYALSHLGETLLRQGKPDEAGEYYAHALELTRVYGDTHLEAHVLSSIAALQLAKSDGDLDAALKLALQAVEIAERMGQSSVWDHIVRTGEIHYYRNDYQRAIECYNRALEGIGTQGSRLTVYQTLFGLSECYEAIGDVAEALRYHKLYIQLKEEVIGHQQQQELMQFRIRMEMERAEKEREIHRLEKQTLQQQMEHKHRDLTTTALHVVEKNEFLDSLKREISEIVRVVDGKTRPALRGLLRQVDAKINDGEYWDTFERQFALVHHDFIKDLSQRCPALTKTELKVCALLRINLTTKDIANILSTSTKTIDAHRYYIRKKLNIPSETNLAAYLAALECVNI